MDDMRSRYRVARPNYLNGNTAPVRAPAPTANPSTSINQVPQSKPIHVAKTKRRKKPILYIAFILIIATIGVAVLYYVKSKSPAIPSSVTQSVSFPVYYPSSLPNGYKYMTGSAKSQSGLLFFKFTNGSSKISATEQSAPSAKIQLSSLPKFSSIKVSEGQASVGTSLGAPSAVLLTNSTLIDLIGEGKASKNDIIFITQNMKPITSQVSP